MSPKDIKNQILAKNKSLPIDFEIIKFPFNRIIKDGFSRNSIYRMSFEEVLTCLENVSLNKIVFNNGLINSFPFLTADK